MNQRTVVGLVCGLVILASTTQLKSQNTNRESQSSHLWWVNLGAGPALVGTHFALSAGMVYCYQFERSIISARIIGETNKNPTVQAIDRSSTIYKMTDYGILYGPMWLMEESFISIGIGIGLVRAAYETPLSITTNTSINFPLEAQWFWRPTYFVGVGIYTYASLNFEKPLYGAMFCAQLGMW